MYQLRLTAFFVPALLLAACAPAPEAQRRNPAVNILPVASEGPVAPPRPLARSNADTARDILELTFQMESGRPVPVLSRFEGPVTLSLAGLVPGSARTDLDALLSRLRAEAGIDIVRVGDDQPASITVEFLSRSALQSIVPQAACFVVPRVSNWAEFRRVRNTARVDWTTLTTRDHAAVFIPNDTSPQEIRDCLHEEIAQALGPLNDLYRLTDSIFNDDNFNTVLTPFDMLALRATYAPELASGMTQTDVAAALPAVLDRLHPAGAGQAAHPAGPTPRAWIDALEDALGGKSSAKAKRDSALRAVALAQNQGWNDGRLAFSLFVLGRLSFTDDTQAAVRAFTAAGRIYHALPGTAAQAAHVDLQLAAYALATGQTDQALALVNQSLSAVSRAQNPALLASLLLIKSEALDKLGHTAEAQAVRLDSAPYAGYGFGPEAQIRARQSEIAALASRRG